MGRAVRSSSFLKPAAALLMLLAAACARNAPDLPADIAVDTPRLSLAEQAMSCDAADAMLAELQNERTVMTGMIEGNRRKNQTAGYLGALFLVPLVAIEQNEAEKRRLDEIQTELDRLYVVRRAKAC
jgi:hypothetical protein